MRLGKFVVPAVVLVALLLLTLMLLMFCSKSEQSLDDTTQMDMTSPAYCQAAPPKADETNQETPVEETAEANIDELEARLLEVVQSQEGTWSLYVKDLQSGAVAQIDSGRMKAASLIKLFVMAAVYEKISDGQLEQTAEIDDLLWNMITVSHNESTNQLVRILGGGDHALGMAQVNEYCQKNGYADTEQQRDLQDWRPAPIPEENYTSARDCGLLLERIYRGDCVSKEADTEMLDLLLAQSRVGKIPAGLPEGATAANKTGELDDTENDAAIIFGANGDYVLCIISNNLPVTETARMTIVSISSEVYEYLDAFALSRASES
jgi:beta-lactamase class A